MNWNEFDKGVFIVNALGIVYNFKTKKILIGKREEDPFIKKLSWCFPGGRPAYKKGFGILSEKEIKKKTGSNVKVREIIFAKTYPENRKFLSIYYHCDFVGGKEKSGEKFVEIKWIKPIEVRKYFTTSIHEKLFDYLEKLR